MKKDTLHLCLLRLVLPLFLVLGIILINDPSITAIGPAGSGKETGGPLNVGWVLVVLTIVALLLSFPLRKQEKMTEC